MVKQVEKRVEKSIRKLCQDEDFAVLATEGSHQPYTSLVGFVTSEDLKYIAFSTTKQTRKYSLIEENKRVSIMIDDRSSNLSSINYISALTITGKARILTDIDEEDKWGELLVNKHPYLYNFVRSSATVIVLVEVFRYFYVRRFQEVSEWIPKNI